MMSTLSVPDFSRIKLVQYKREESVKLTNIFDAVLKSENLNVGHKDLEQMLSSELNIDFSTLHENIKLSLIDSLMYYMTVWPGWQRFDEYHKGHLTWHDWFERFRQYLILKTRFVIKSALQFVQAEDPNKKHATTQTEVDYKSVPNRGKPFAPYTVAVAGPIPVLNNIVFVKSDDNVMVKQFPVKDWLDLKIAEFYNWPYVSVELNILDISLSRTVAHQVHRYMALCDDLVIIPKVEHVVYAKKLCETQEQQSFSHEFFQCYFSQLTQLLKDVPGTDYNRILEIQELLSEFLKDISDIDLNNKSMCTNVNIGYNIGNACYVRSRKMVKSQEKDSTQDIISFYEILIPQVDLTLELLSAEQDEYDSRNVTFKNLNELKYKLNYDITQGETLKVKEFIDTCIVYKCTACSETFSGISSRCLALNHFKSVHKGEQSVLCHKCRKEFDIQVLAMTRWKHTCVE